MAPSVSELAFSASSMEDKPLQTLSVSRTSEYMFGKWTAVITGEDGDAFTAEVADHNQFASSFTVNVTFIPNGRKSNYAATLRLTSPNAPDILIPLSGTAPAASALGDVNCDGKVDVSDVTTLVSKILGDDPVPFNPSAADVKADSILDVSDVTALITIILA